MPKKMKYPSILDLEKPGDFILVRGDESAKHTIEQYAYRKGWKAVVERQDEPVEVTGEAGVLWRVERQ